MENKLASKFLILPESYVSKYLISILEQMKVLPRTEKLMLMLMLMLMEALWSDLSLVEEELDSPGWHEDALR